MSSEQLPVLTPAQLATYTGANAEQPVYVAIEENVYDVSSRRDFYGPGGAYHVFAGKNAARALARSSLAAADANSTDLSDLNADEKETLAQWKTKFAKYPIVAKLQAAVQEGKSNESSHL